jgi:hypothetical protein
MTNAGRAQSLQPSSNLSEQASPGWASGFPRLQTDGSSWDRAQQSERESNCSLETAIATKMTLVHERNQSLSSNFRALSIFRP